MKTKKILAVTLCALALVQTPSAQADKRDLGTLFGAIIGGVIGNNAGNGDAGATIAGAVIGGVIGNVIGKELDENDRQEMMRARLDCLERNEQSEWRGRGGYGSIVVIDEGYHATRNTVVCRSYENTIYYNGRRETTRGYACRDNYGQWNEVQQTEITFGNRRHYPPQRREIPQPMPDYNRPNYPPVFHGSSLSCMPGQFRSAMLVDNRSNRQVTVFSEMGACQFALQNQRGASICIEGQNRNAFAIDIRTRQAIGMLYRDLGDCVRNLR